MSRRVFAVLLALICALAPAWPAVSVAAEATRACCCGGQCPAGCTQHESLPSADGAVRTTLVVLDVVTATPRRIVSEHSSPVGRVFDPPSTVAAFSKAGQRPALPSGTARQARQCCWLI